MKNTQLSVNRKGIIMRTFCVFFVYLSIFVVVVNI